MIAIAAIEIGALVMIIVSVIVAIRRELRRDRRTGGDIVKPRCENCRNHAVNPHTPNSPMVICTQEGANVHRWYKCDCWESEDGECQTCEHSRAIYDDPDCVYVWCEKEGQAVSRYYSADCWEKKKVH